MSTSREDLHLDKLSKPELAALALERAQKVGYITLRVANSLESFVSCSEKEFRDNITLLENNAVSEDQSLTNKNKLILITKELGSMMRVMYEQQIEKIAKGFYKARPESSMVKEIEDQLPNAIADIVITAKQQKANDRVS